MAERDGGLAADVPLRPPTQEDPEPTATGERDDVAARFRPLLAGQRQTDPSWPTAPEAESEAAGSGTAESDAATDEAHDFDRELDGDADGAPPGELRAALDELRRVLEVDSTAPPVRRRRGRRLLVALAAVLVLVAAALVIRHQVNSRVSSADVERAVAGQLPPPAVHLGSPAPSAAATTPALSTPQPTLAPLEPQPSVSAPASLPSTGPGITEPGTYITAAVDSGPDADAVDVYEQVVFPGPGLDSLPLSLVPASSLQADLASARLQVTDLQVALDGQVARAVPTGANTWAATAVQGGRFTKAQLRYRVEGAIVRSTPSLAGRALVVITPLTGSWALTAQQPVLLRVSSAGVRGINCPNAAPTEVLCGSAAGQTWTATLPRSATSPVFVLQADLVPPS